MIGFLNYLEVGLTCFADESDELYERKRGAKGF